ncbi:MAG TPA: class I SAM-dependent methyltransferase [archaeon]|nr:class I SAM-dependent methyltransferase [archaeon]
MKKDQIEPEKYPKVYQDYLRKEEKLVIKFLKGTGSVLDVGCGTARLAPKISSLVNQYVGVEISSEYFKIARDRSQRFRNIKIIKLNAENLSKKFEKGQFDKTISTWNTVGCLKDDKKVIKEIFKVTKNKVFFSVLPRGSLEKRIEYYNKLKVKHTVDRESEIIKSRQWGVVRAYSDQDIRNLVKNTGFKIEKLKQINNVGFVVYLRK